MSEVIFCPGCEVLTDAAATRTGGGGFRWNWLRGEGPLERNVALRHRPFHDTKDRLARLAIQDVHVTRLGRECHRRNPASVSDDVDESRGCGWIRIPHVMVNRLKVKLVCAGLNVHRHYGVSIEVGPGAIASVATRNRRRERQVEKSALFIQREVERPGVGAEPTLPAVTVPRVVTNAARLRQPTEFPKLRTGAGVKGTRISNRASRPRRVVGAHHDDVSVNERHRVVRHRRYRPDRWCQIRRRAYLSEHRRRSTDGRP